MLLERPGWMARGRCVGTMKPGYAEMFPSKEDEKGIERAKATCNTGPCPVIEECLDYALTRREKDGIWGGTSEQERNRFLRQQRKSA